MKQFDNVPVELVLAAKNGDERAIDEVCERKKAVVIAIARKFFLQGGETEDLVQEGMIGLYKAILSYDPEKNDCFDAYAALCVQRRILSAIRSAARDKNKPLDEGVSIDAVAEAAGGPMPEEEYFRREELAAYERAREALSEFERSVLDAYLQGDSYREIAEEFGTDPKKIDNTLQRAKQRIKEKIGRTI